MTPSLHRAPTTRLDIAYEEDGPPDGFPVLLLHGWPDDVRTWDRVAPALQAAGLRTIAPYLRGFGPTRFRDPGIPRSGQLAALGADLLDLADALGLSRFAVVGHDWGARAAYIAACLAPDRIAACVALSVGWGTNAPTQTLSLTQAQNYWYHWLMALPRGEALMRGDPLGFVRHIWTIWNPGLSDAEAEFAATVASLENPDWAEVTLHSYRVRWGAADPDPHYATLEARLAADPVIRVPTLMLHGGSDPCNEPATSENREALFAERYRRVVLPGIGHFPQREAPDAVLAEVLPFLASLREGSAPCGHPPWRPPEPAPTASGTAASVLSAFAALLWAKPPAEAVLSSLRGRHPG